MSRLPSPTPAALILLLPILLAGCATGDRPYPSLERRAVERQYGTMAPVAGPEVVPSLVSPSPGLSGRLSALRSQALDAHRQFQAREAAASRAVQAGAGSAIASESWSVAQVALAQLESARSNAMIALSDLDSLLVEAAKANALAPSADYAAITATRDEVTGWIASEDRTLAALRGRMRN